MRLITHFQGSMPCIPTTTPSRQTMPPQYGELTICQNNHFSATYIFVTTAHICTTMTNFCRHLSNCQFHHTIQILVVITTVLTITTMHNTALGTTVPNAPHFLCQAKVSAHICLPIKYIMIDQKIVPTLPNLFQTIVQVHTVVCVLLTYVTIVRLAVLVLLYHTLVDSMLGLS
jgi:hypothetical protein